VTVNSSSQYSSRMGQNTGTSNMGNNVIVIPIQIDFIDDHLHIQTQGRVSARCSNSGRAGPAACRHPDASKLPGLRHSTALLVLLTRT
jgi:hypothetical protein